MKSIKGLRQEIERCFYYEEVPESQWKLKGIKQTVKVLNNSDTMMENYEDEKEWRKIKKLLNL